MIEIGNRKFELATSNGVSNYVDMSVALKDEETTLFCYTRNADGQLYDPAAVVFELYSKEGNKLKDLSVDRLDIGKWQVKNFFDKTDSYVGKWRSSDGDIALVMVISVDMRLKFLMERLRSILDKSLKSRENTWGYTDVDLFMYLVNAVGTFNSVPPLTNYSVVNIPFVFESRVLDLATLNGLVAQMVYSVDTDVSYNDQGLSLNIDHFGKLSSLYGQLADRVMDGIKKVKGVLVFSTVRSVAAFNPERTRAFMFPHLAVPGFPYFAFGAPVANIFFGR